MKTRSLKYAVLGMGLALNGVAAYANETTATRLINFDTYLSRETRLDFFDRMELPSKIQNMFYLLDARSDSPDPSEYRGMEHYLSGDVRCVETLTPGTILWSPSCLKGQEPEELFLKYLHQLVRSSYTRSGIPRSSTPPAELYASALDPYFRTLLTDPDPEKRAQAQTALRRTFDVISYTDLIREQILADRQHRSAGYYISSMIVVNGKRAAGYLRPFFSRGIGEEGENPEYMQRVLSEEGSLLREYAKRDKFAALNMLDWLADYWSYRDYCSRVLGLSESEPTEYENLHGDLISFRFESEAGWWTFSIRAKEGGAETRKILFSATTQSDIHPGFVSLVGYDNAGRSNGTPLSVYGTAHGPYLYLPEFKFMPEFKGVDSLNSMFVPARSLDAFASQRDRLAVIAAYAREEALHSR